jgi:hypothetical protein
MSLQVIHEYKKGYKGYSCIAPDGSILKVPEWMTLKETERIGLIESNYLITTDGLIRLSGFIEEMLRSLSKGGVESDGKANKNNI